MRIIITIVLFLSLTGCASFWEWTKPIEAFDESKLDNIILLDLCHETWLLNWNKRLTPAAYEQLLSYLERKGLLKEEIEAARIGGIRIGGSECSLYLARGRSFDINTTITKYGTNKQHVYKFPNRYYVYTENGIITAIQQ